MTMGAWLMEEVGLATRLMVKGRESIIVLRLSVVFVGLLVGF
jgi:hypothetical protein